MIGDLVHYNCAGSEAIGVVVDFFRYESHKRSYMLPESNELVVAVEWIKKDKNMPRPMTPNYGMAGEPTDAFCWPEDWDTRKWYRYRWFKTVSEASGNKETKSR